jgi:hypothetical protein
MIENLFNKKLLNIILPLFFILGSIYPTFRVLIIGSDASSNLFEMIISIFPDILISLGIILFTYNLLINNKLEKYKIKFKIVDYLVIIYLVGNILIGSLLSGNNVHSLYAFRMTYFPVFFYFIGRFHKPFDENTLELFFKYFFYWLLGVAFIGILLYFPFQSIMLKMIDLSGGRKMEYFIIRMTSLFWSPVLFAPFMMIGALYSYYNLLLKKGKLYYFFLLIFYLCLIYSVSRGSFITFIIGFVILSFYIRNLKGSIISILLLLILTSTLVLSNESFSKAFFWIFSSSIDTMSLTKGITRVELFYKTIDDLKVNPFGYGFGKAGVLATRFYTENTPNISYYSTDCWYLKIACETGLFGIISYLSILLFNGWSSLFFCFKKKQYLFFFMFILFILINIENIVHNLPDFYLLSQFYWLIIGFSQNYISIENEKK